MESECVSQRNKLFVREDYSGKRMTVDEFSACRNKIKATGISPLLFIAVKSF